jgi:hypothetical protein
LSKQSFDIKSLQKYLNPEAANDFSRFLDTVPVHAGKGVLIAAGIAWAAVAVLGSFTVLQSKQITELRAELQANDALKPVVPTVAVNPVTKEEVNKISDKFKAVYPNLNFAVTGTSLSIKSKQTADFAQFREAIGHVVNGGKGWKVTVDSLCVGRECKDAGLGALLKIQKLKIDKPQT